MDAGDIEDKSCDKSETSRRTAQTTSNRGGTGARNDDGNTSACHSGMGGLSDSEDSLPSIADISGAKAALQENMFSLEDYLGESPHPLGLTESDSHLPLTPVNSQANSSSFIRIAASNILIRKYVRVLEAAELQDSDFHVDNISCTEKVLRELLEISEECARQVIRIIAKGLSK